MIQAFAPRMPRGFSWVWLAIVAVAWAPVTVLAQASAPPKGEAKPLPDEPKPAAKDEPKPAAKDEPANDEPDAEVFIDPNAKKTLAIFSPLLYRGPEIKLVGAGNDLVKVQNMTSRAVNIDAEFLKKYIEFFAVELTKRDNLNALINPPPGKSNDAQARKLESAVDALMKPLFDGKANNHPEFLNLYTRLLFESPLARILENNYLTRIDAMIVLGMAGSTLPNALNLYIDQIKKPEQVIWVKLWAARGLTNAAQHGAADLDAAKANLAAEALVAWLASDPKLPWPAQMRALEALGSVRVALATNPRKVDAASVAMKFLSDPEAKPEVRAWAAWALGMMKVPPAIIPYNFPLIGQEIGQLTADLGQRIIQDFDADPANFDREKDLAAHLTALLLFQAYPALVGEDGVRDSGLLHSPHKNATEARPFLSKLDDKVKTVSRSAYELLRAGGAGNKGARNDLEAKLVDLKSFLGQTDLKDRHLVPGGPEFAPNPNAQVAGAARH